MEFTGERKFATPEEEIAFLRNEIKAREQELISRAKDINSHDRENLGKEVIREYGGHSPETILPKERVTEPHMVAGQAETISLSHDRVHELIQLSVTEGIRNTLSVLEKMKDPFLTDELHRELVKLIRGGTQIADLKEAAPLWAPLHTSLFEIALPRHKDDAGPETPLKTLFLAMEQFFAGMQTIGRGSKRLYYSIEIAVADKSNEIIFYVAVPNEFINLFEKQTLSLFPNAVVTLQQNDYNIFVEGGSSKVATLSLAKHPIHPLKMGEEFENDPLAVLLNAFSKIEHDGGGAAVQIIIGGGASKYHDTYAGIVKRMEKGEKKDVAIRKSTVTGGLYEEMKDIFFTDHKDHEKKKEKQEERKGLNNTEVELFREKLKSPIVDTNVRIVTSATTDARAEQILLEIESSFHQFQNTLGNKFRIEHLTGGEMQQELRSFSFREFNESRTMPLSLLELASVIHFPSQGLESSPQFKQSRAKFAPAPLDLPQHGLLLGENDFRNIKTKVYLTPEDRLRHLYVIGQTGTGKSGFLQSMVMQDIKDGAGVCFIDPHGKDVIEVMSMIPPERMDDLIYFDPARLDRVLGLNMLEYDPTRPEQKTFVVNELFSIFQKLYGANPESMGPMFEQYFRNATQLVLEDPESGSTLLDISRVFVDSAFRRLKLSKSNNPVVNQFWRDIATKASGEQALENFVPYITSKFDVFTANDYMRPIVGQQRSSFNFREIMDQKKILLVNLSKGRLGEINANLIGMVLVGKMLMAALSRADNLGGGWAPFYLYIDEFQNITTNSIASILSEARKYKLSLTVAHQFIAQLDENIRDAVFGNVGSMAVFRVGSEDAEVFEKQFTPTFTASDLMNIENRNAYMRIIANGTPTPPFSMRTYDLPKTDPEYAQELVEYSLLKYGMPREVVEADIRARYQ